MSHAVLSPSAAHRWMNCTAAPRLEEKFEDNTSEAAREGTVAHAICAEMLIQLRDFGGINKDAIISTLKCNEDGEDLEVFLCPEMIEFCEGYASYVFSEFVKEKKITPDSVLMVETNIDISAYGPEMSGTTDAAIVSDGLLHIFDFKYGKGVKVDADSNPQMMIYALGNMLKYCPMYAFEKVKMTIYQPRIDNISTYESSVSYLDEWGEVELRPKAADAFEGKGDKKAGEWCKFCKARGCCKALKEYQMAPYNSMKEKDFDIMGDDEITEIVIRANEIKSWLGCVEEYALTRLKNGDAIEGLKLVEGKSNRKYTNDTIIIDVLRKNGFSEDQIMESKLKGITSLTKTLTKKVFDSLLSEYIVKPQGSPTVVGFEDPRPAFGSNDFDNIDI